MKVEVLATGRLLQLRFVADVDDPVAVEGQPQLVRDRITAQVPEGYTTERVHPDVLALVALLCVRPWISSRFDLSWKVSTNFASAVERKFKIAISRVDPDLRPRTAPTESVPALAFSGGDCRALPAVAGISGRTKVRARRVIRSPGDFAIRPRYTTDLLTF